MYGLLFTDNDEAAFSNQFLWQNIGYLIVYLYAAEIRVKISIILQIIYLTLSMVGYFILEIKERKRNKDDKNHNDRGEQDFDASIVKF
ncbi:unnamed protein product [Didymodactylos carnosus]|uniref:Uncharacterized protein n=2 Tax=Didymodactylos carnosus TaxID=1234261 RepID=A0A815NEM2_9BILA|nr:unnamed protein product [Didymodactylos carnosus]CAF4312954.1 unnamed protein product [Didymodactylos carnosus]